MAQIYDRTMTQVIGSRLLAVLLVGATWPLLGVTASAKQITGTPGSPNATTTIDAGPSPRRRSPSRAKSS